MLPARAKTTQQNHSNMATISASRFALLHIDDDYDSDENKKKGKQNGKQAGQQTNAAKKKNKKKKKGEQQKENEEVCFLHFVFPSPTSSLQSKTD